MGIYVVFFGGYQSSKTDMALWLASARKQRSDIVFDAYPFPIIKQADAKSAVDNFKQFDEVIKQIQDSGADTLFIVGHSSGCAIANELNSRIKGDHGNITVVDLDGFAPNPGQIKKSSMQAWSAEGDGGRAHSLNWAAGHLMFHAAQATNEWSLHFSLVNKAATDAITKANYRIMGYAGCIANLDFLDC